MKKTVSPRSHTGLFRPWLGASLRPLLVGLFGGLAYVGCGSGDEAPGPAGAGAAPAASGGGGNASGGSAPGAGSVIIDPGPMSPGGHGGSRPVAVIEETLPDGFTPETNGGWKVIGPLADFDEPSENVCANVLRVIARDFSSTHVDFGQHKPPGPIVQELYTGLVQATLGADRKPVIHPDRSPNVIDDFSDWYVTTEETNVAYVMDLWLEPKPGEEGTFVFDSDDFFPLDEHNSWDEIHYGGGGRPHNFLFTTELHTAFEYKGGEVFNFRGDDDVWVFINGKLAVDLGGIHGPVEGEVDLDESAEALGIEVGNVYTLDLFQAERNPTGSNFRIETSLDFRECGILQQDIIR